MPDTFYTRLAKPALERALAATGLIVLAPVLVGVAALVRSRLGSPVLFRQVRPGRDGVPFEMLKFRTMTDARDTSGELLPDAERLVPLGRFLRSSSLDELPELWNVVRGEMSLIGPRPLLTAYLSRYSAHHARRHEVRPGITGAAQVSGRQDIPFSKRLDLDVWYVDHVGPLTDARILLQTVRSVLGARGVQNGQDVADVDDLGLFHHAPDA